MKVQYLQKYGFTYITMGGMNGASRRRPEDKRDDDLGLAVALLKADFKPLYGQENLEVQLAFGEVEESDMNKLELSDWTVAKWADIRHEFRLALRAVAEKRAEPIAYEFVGLGDYLNPPIHRRPDDPYEKKRRIPSDGQIGESFGKRLLSETKLSIPKDG